MKPTKSNRNSLLLATSGLLFSGALHSQTVEINPAGAIPAIYTLAQSWEWNTEADLEGWAANAGGLTLETGTPTTDDVGPPANGSVKGTADSNDPTFTSPVTTIATPYRVIIEMRVRKEASDATRMDLFWDDAAGGFGGPRLYSIPAATLAPDDTFKVVRITFPFSKISGQLDKLRFDPISDAAGIGETVAIDYLRVYTEILTPLSWDTDTVTTGAQGGTGTWDQLTSNLWWNGAANTTWPASGVAATFGATAGTVTVAGGGVNANLADFQATGYTVTGGPINIGSDSARISNGAGTTTTRIDSSLTGSAPLQLAGGSFVLGGNSNSLSGPVTQVSKLGITNNSAVGTNTLTMGAGGNVFFSALDGDRTLSNNVIFAGNRMVIDNVDLGTGLAVGNLTIDGSLALNCISPGDLYLRKNLTVNGVVSGSNSNIGLLLAANPGTIKLSNAGNNFTGGIKWSVGATVEADSNGALGDLANTLNFNAGAGTLKLLAAFDSARAVNINGSTEGKIDTNGFDMELSGTITGTATLPAQAKFTKTGTGVLTLTGTGSVIQGGLRVLGGRVEIPSGALSYTQWDGASGVAGNAELLINGGTLTTNGSYLAVGNGTNPTQTALLTLSSGSLVQGLELLTAQNGNGTFTITGGLANLNQLSFGDGPDASRTAIINLNGGTVSLNRTNRRGGAATATINFNGAMILAKSDQSDFLRGDPSNTTYAVQAGGAIIDSADSDLGILVPLQAGSPSGGLTKNGLGTLTLAPVGSPNSYTGPTTVNLGTLAVSGTSINDLGKLDIVGGKVLIPAATNEVVDTLFYNGVQQPAGIYGSTASDADHENDTYFDVAGTGTLTVNSGPGGNTYATWASAFTSPILSPSGPTADADFDGLSNLVEYVTGGDPRVSSQTGRPTSSTAGGVITFSFNRVDSSETPDVTTIVQVSTDLVDWTTLPSYTVGADTASSTAGVAVDENGAAADGITVTIPNSNAASKFARLIVVTTP